MGDWVGLGGKGGGRDQFCPETAPGRGCGQFSSLGGSGCTALAFHCIEVQRGIQRCIEAVTDCIGGGGWY